MVISQDEARLALAEVAAVESKSRTSLSYRYSSPHAILWGAIWVIGYTLDGFLSPALIQWSWLTLVAIGIISAVFIQRRWGSAQAKLQGVLWIPAMLFYIAVLTIMQPHELRQFEAFPALCVALMWGYFGIFRGPGFIWFAAFLFVATLVGYYWLVPYYSFWMAAIGGGGLIASGLWLRSR